MGRGEDRKPIVARKFRWVDVKCRLTLPYVWPVGYVTVTEVDSDTVLIRQAAVVEGQPVSSSARRLDSQGRVILPASYACEAVQVGLDESGESVVVKRVNVVPVSKRPKKSGGKK